MNIFVDRHHDGLYASLQLLFEKRLGHTLYHPYGMDWFDSGNWKIGDPYGPTARGTALQFLDSGPVSDGTPILFPYRGMSFAEFKEFPIDIIIASYYPHIEVYEKLRQQYHPNAKLIVQMGNEWPLHPLCKNLLASVKPFPVSSTVNAVFYHQEFDTSQFHFEENSEVRSKMMRISSFVNALPQNDLFTQDWKDFQTLEHSLLEFQFKSFGGGCREGSLQQYAVQLEMQWATFGLHFKEGGDGYGHVIHQWAACGTPVIFKSHQYEGKLAEVLLEDGKTGFDWDKAPLDNLVRRLKSCSLEERAAMGQEIRRRFEQYVDFDEEQQKIEEFLSCLN